MLKIQNLKKMMFDLRCWSSVVRVFHTSVFSKKKKAARKRRIVKKTKKMKLKESSFVCHLLENWPW